MQPRDDQSRLEELARELRRSRPQPPDRVVDSLLATIRGAERGASSRTTWRRVGPAIALSGLMLVAIASFGGIGYAGSAASDAVKKVQRSGSRQVHASLTRALGAKTPSSVQAPSSADKVYGSIVPPPPPPPASPTTPPPPPASPPPPSKPKGGGHAGGNAGSAGGTSGAKHGQGTAGAKASGGANTGSNLPFTGLALWIPMLAGVLLLGFGLFLRSRGRRRDAAV